MAGKDGAFSDALNNMRSTSNSEDTRKPKPAPRSATATQPPAARAESVSEVKRLRAPNPSSRTEPFSQRIDIDVQNVLYSLARKNKWTMNRTLREAARALSVEQGDKNGDGL